MSPAADGTSTFKRKRPEPKAPGRSPTDQELVLYELIRSKKDMGIWTGDMKRETNLPDNIVTKCLKSLQTKKLIKEVVNIQNKGRKHFMAVEFEPSNELSGGAWYVKGSLDTELIHFIREICLKQIRKMRVATAERLGDMIKESGVFNIECSSQQIEEILKVLVLDKEIVEARSSGSGEFASVPIGAVCYKCARTGGGLRVGAMASMPCGTCPRIHQCTPEGVISPKTCVYYDKWLDF